MFIQQHGIDDEGQRHRRKVADALELAFMLATVPGEGDRDLAVAIASVLETLDAERAETLLAFWWNANVS